MNRILNLQSLNTIPTSGGLEPESSTSSGSGCNCSTSSYVACFMPGDLVAI